MFLGTFGAIVVVRVLRNHLHQCRLVRLILAMMNTKSQLGVD